MRTEVNDEKCGSGIQHVILKRVVIHEDSGGSFGGDFRGGGCERSFRDSQHPQPGPLRGLAEEARHQTYSLPARKHGDSHGRRLCAGERQGGRGRRVNGSRRGVHGACGSGGHGEQSYPFLSSAPTFLWRRSARGWGRCTKSRLRMRFFEISPRGCLWCEAHRMRRPWPRKAIQSAQAGRPGPVYLEVPTDLFRARKQRRKISPPKQSPLKGRRCRT